MIEKRRTITNESDRLMLVWTEPIAEDYWLKPGESLEIVAKARSESCDYELEVHEEGVTVSAHADMDFFFTVLQRGVELKCGHQRPGGWR